MQHWIYHPKEQPKIVETEEYNYYLNHGWYDSPDKCKPQKGGIAGCEKKDVENVSYETLEVKKPKRGGRRPRLEAAN